MRFRESNKIKEPYIINGGSVEDSRGSVIFVNDFDLKEIRRFYQISNCDTNFERGWQGHKIESRWFQSLKGTISLSLIAFEDYKKGDKVRCSLFELSCDKPQVLYVPPGYVSCIKAKTKEHCLGVFSNYSLNAIKDEVRFELDYFDTIIEKRQ
ncbi:hypothetical protein LX97_02570 [Nonlabens dokdonensis]|uniref:Sugar epimerase n=2 Tax=Nonlabens dokdonensis TaxID=328515 RepID=A0ABX5PWF2_9FLAO|nr:sugar epimerase [Nonlabens dokdonensis]AGC78669.1 putative sugar epimerase [Nonlabens dokdonensis DSW-6]PZX39204.1 hypothetical protein LX97_02570 [Nonlabens dokdonensis]